MEAIFRYPVKSMAGESLETAELGWHGLEGDRRLALRRMEDRSGFPWLQASKLPDLLRFAPHRAAEFMHQIVKAHQLTSEAPATVQRTPENYAAHIEEMRAMFGQFTLEITELIASSDRRVRALAAARSAHW